MVFAGSSFQLRQSFEGFAMPQSSSISLGLEDLGVESQVIGFEHLGTNMLFHTDRTDPNSDFSALVDAFGIASLRYPGGTIAEQFFDPANPNNTVGNNFFDIVSGSTRIGTRDILPISEYLNFISQIGGTATIVFPTYRYFDPDTRAISPAGLEEISNFFTRLFSGEFGPIDNLNIELGNEWYQHRLDWTVAEFGQLQAQISEMIASTAIDYGTRELVNIFAQGGRNQETNSVLSSYFEGNNSGYVDGVLTHIYGINASGNTLGIGGGIPGRLEEMLSTWESATNSQLLLAVTEWNVGESGEDSTLINGLMRSAPLLRMFVEMVEADVDLAHFWSIQTAGPAGLSGREGTGDDWSPTGYLFNMLIEGALGAQLVDTGEHFRLRDESNSAIGYNFTFSDQNSTNIFLSSGVEWSSNVELDLSNILDGASHIYFTRLTSAPGTSGIEYNAEASIEFLTAINATGSGVSSELLNIYLGMYETVQITVTYGTGVEIRADHQNEVEDWLTGSGYADTLMGDLGDDTLEGLSGADILDGGAGRDIIHGGEGHDTIYGGAGRDDIYGEHGRDLIDGGEGSDLLVGGHWHDTILGGEGDDTLEGGFGHDDLNGGEGDDSIFGEEGNDYIMAGFGSDTIDGGLGNDTLSFEDSMIGVTIWSGSGYVEIGADLVESNSIEVFWGSSFSDRLSIRSSGQELYGLAGDDTAQILWGNNSSIELGEGNDTARVYSGYNNIVRGGEGNDTFYSIGGFANIFEGGTGSDEFNFLQGENNLIYYGEGDGEDVVAGFDLLSDQIILQDRGLEDSMQIEQYAGGTNISFGNGDAIFLIGVLDTSVEQAIDFVLI